MTDTLKIEAGKEYLTRDGNRARIYATDGGVIFPVHGAIYEDGEGWDLASWTDTGKIQNSSSTSGYDIISEAPKTIAVDCWLWVFDGRFPLTMDKPWEDADTAGTKPVAQFRLTRTVQHGEGM